MISYIGTWHDGTSRLEILYGPNTVVWDMGYVGDMVYGKNTMWYGMCSRYGTGKTRYMVWYVCGMIPWYGAVDVLYG